MNPLTANNTNTELDATINPDNSVKLDFIVHGLSGNFYSSLPDWLDAFLWNPFAGGNPPDPHFSFTADLDVQINLPAPSQGFKSFGQPSFSITATNIQYSGYDWTADIAQVANGVVQFLPSSIGVDNPNLDSKVAVFVNIAFQPLESAMQQTATFGTTQFRQ